MAKLRRAIARFRPDVVHVQHVHLWFSLLLPTLRRYPLVITVHDPVHHVGDVESARPRSGWCTGAIAEPIN